MTWVTRANANDAPRGSLCVIPEVSRTKLSLVFSLNHAAGIFSALAVSTVIAVAAWRARSLSAGGGVAAFALGVAALRVSWRWGLLLILWFVLASTVSRVGQKRKAVRVAGIAVKGDRRDARQVLANGGVFLLSALVVIFITPSPAHNGEWNVLLAAAAAGSLAAAAADTWATEIGTLYGQLPWSFRTRARVAVGTSGAITWSGTSAMVVGGVSIALLAALLGVIAPDFRSLVAVALGGVIGAFTDTLVGAWLQERRWCMVCELETEQTVHACGNRTRRMGGIARLDNDVVNAFCTAVGALFATLLT